MASLRRLDEDGDSTMQSSPDDDKLDLFPSADTPTTPKVASSELSPPTSQGRGISNDPLGSTAAAAIVQTGTNASTLNENGKRSLPMGAGTAKGPQTHLASGYRWEKDEDAPGYAWKNKRAAEDAARAWDNVVDKDRMIGTRYGDVLDPVGAGSAAA